MSKVKYKQRNIQERIIIALVLLCLVACAVNVQLYLEYRAVAHKATYTDKLGQQENFFDMSINELMEVVVVSRSGVRPSSQLLNFQMCIPLGSKARLT